MIAAGLFAILLLFATVLIHAEGLGLARRHIQSNPNGDQLRLAAVVSSALCLHIIEIGLYSVVIWFLNAVVNAGDIVGAREFYGMDYFYYSAETFTGLGAGDLSATGGLRLLASLEPLNGLVLIAWTGAFTYWTMEYYWNAKLPTRIKAGNG